MTVQRIRLVIMPLQVMQKREPLNNSGIHVVMLSQQQAVVPYPAPVRRAVNTTPIETEAISRKRNEAAGNQRCHISKHT